MALMAEYPSWGGQRAVGTGSQIKEPDKPFNMTDFSELQYIDS